jgi:hypothetical protein
MLFAGWSRGRGCASPRSAFTERRGRRAAFRQMRSGREAAEWGYAGRVGGRGATTSPAEAKLRRRSWRLVVAYHFGAM